MGADFLEMKVKITLNTQDPVNGFFVFDYPDGSQDRLAQYQTRELIDNLSSGLKMLSDLRKASLALKDYKEKRINEVAI